MTNADAFELIIRTPHQVVFEKAVRSARLPTETGHVGLRPRTEPSVLAIEPGLVHALKTVAARDIEMFIGTAGGLLTCDRNRATLLTPLAVVGDDEESIVRQLDDLMQRPNTEWEARTTLGKLETHILSELRREQTGVIKPRLD